MAMNLPNDIKKKPGRPKKKQPSLTDKQQVFIEKYIETGNKQEAKQIAGYSEKTQLSSVCTPEVQNAIIVHVNKTLHEYAPIAVQTMINLSEHAKNDKVRLDATKDILDRAGFKPAEKREITGANGLPLEARITHELIQRYMKAYDD